MSDLVIESLKGLTEASRAAFAHMLDGSDGGDTWCAMRHLPNAKQNIDRWDAALEAAELIISGQSEMDGPIAVEKFMRANGVVVDDYDMGQFGYCYLTIEGTLLQGKIAVSLSMTRRQAIDMLRAFGMPVSSPYAG